METVLAYMTKEVEQKRVTKDKRETQANRIKQMYGRRGGGAENGEENDEIDELATKLEKLDLTEEARKISQQELKKLKALGPRN